MQVLHMHSFLLGLSLCAAGAVPLDVPQDAPPKLRVVTTLGFLARLAEQVGGDRVEVSSLCDARQDPHFVEPRPTLMQRARQADLFVEVGLSLELWADKVADGSGNPRIQAGQPGRVIASAGITTLELPRELSRAWGDVHPGGNPHLWLDPLNAGDMAGNIVAGLVRVDPQHAEDYRTRLAALQADLEVRLFGRDLVDEVGGAKLARLARQGRLAEYLKSHELSARLGGWLARAAPLRGRPVVSYHKTFVYFAERFGLELPVQIEELPGIPPSARHRDEVVRVMRERGVKCLLLETFYDRAAADYLAEQTGARVEVVPIDAGPEVGLASYPELIDRLLDALLAAEAAQPQQR
jgi:zinc/manganese transport system substrate-binding protein